MMVLWLLILRGISIEFRSHVGGHIWSVFWDAVFSLASALLAIFFGAALGNVVRGVPLDAAGNFFEPLWTNFQPTGQTGILDWYTILIGVAALAVLALHGAVWLAWRTTDELQYRAHAAASLLWWLVAALTVIVTFTSFHLMPVGLLSFRVHPFGFVFPMLAIAGLLGVKFFLRSEQEARAFAASAAYIVGMLTSVTFTLYPNVLPATTGLAYNLTVANAKAADYGLKIGLIWWLTRHVPRRHLHNFHLHPFRRKNPRQRQRRPRHLLAPPSQRRFRKAAPTKDPLGFRFSLRPLRVYGNRSPASLFLNLLQEGFISALISVHLRSSVAIFTSATPATTLKPDAAPCM